MLYHLYELNQAALHPARATAEAYRLMWRNPLNPASRTALGRGAAAALELFERSTRRYRKPAWGIDTVEVDGRGVGVVPRTVLSKPFCNLVHFERDLTGSRRRKDPKVLVVAPMAGHFATLLRGTVRDLLPDHDVYVTEWQDARFVPRAAGAFDLDVYIDYITEFLRAFEGDVHIMAVCQPTVPVFAAVSITRRSGQKNVAALRGEKGGERSLGGEVVLETLCRAPGAVPLLGRSPSLCDLDHTRKSLRTRVQLCGRIITTYGLRAVILLTQFDYVLSTTNTDGCKAGLDLIIGECTAPYRTGNFAQTASQQVKNAATAIVIICRNDIFTNLEHRVLFQVNFGTVIHQDVKLGTRLGFKPVALKNSRVDLQLMRPAVDISGIGQTIELNHITYFYFRT